MEPATAQSERKSFRKKERRREGSIFQLVSNAIREKAGIVQTKSRRRTAPSIKSFDFNLMLGYFQADFFGKKARMNGRGREGKKERERERLRERKRERERECVPEIKDVKIRLGMER